MRKTIFRRVLSPGNNLTLAGLTIKPRLVVNERGNTGLRGKAEVRVLVNGGDLKLKKRGCVGSPSTERK